MIGYGTLITGSIMYNIWLKESEFTVMMVIACIVNFVGAFTTMMFCKGWFLGLPPVVFTIMTSTVTDTLY